MIKVNLEFINSDIKNDIFSIILGVILGSVFCTLNIIVSLKTGLGFGSSQVVALVGYVFLKRFERYSLLQNNIVQASASGGYLSMFAIDSAAVACLIFKKTEINIFMISIIGIIAIILGIIAAYYFENSFIKEDKLPFPTGLAVADTIAFLNKDKNSEIFRFLIKGIIVSLIINSFVKIFEIIPDNILNIVPLSISPFIGIVVSPLIFALGYIIEFKASILVFVGSVISSLVWFFVEQHSSVITYSNHLNNPIIFSLGISAMLFSSIYTLWNMRKLLHHTFTHIRKRYNFRKNLGFKFPHCIIKCNQGINKNAS